MRYRELECLRKLYVLRKQHLYLTIVLSKLKIPYDFQHNIMYKR